jgi:hypothetical protein
MSKKDCFGSESYVCRTQNCAYMSECVKVVWEKKLRRILARKPAAGSATAPSLLTKTSSGVRLRAKEFTPATRAREE